MRKNFKHNFYLFKNFEKKYSWVGYRWKLGDFELIFGVEERTTFCDSVDVTNIQRLVFRRGNFGVIKSAFYFTFSTISFHDPHIIQVVAATLNRIIFHIAKLY